MAYFVLFTIILSYMLIREGLDKTIHKNSKEKGVPENKFVSDCFKIFNYT